MKSEDEEEDAPVADRQEEEVDEAELEAFLDGQLAERHPFLQQEGSRRGIAIDSQQHNSLNISKAEDALQTCKFHVKGSVHTNYKKTCFCLLVVSRRTDSFDLIRRLLFPVVLLAKWKWTLMRRHLNEHSLLL